MVSPEEFIRYFLSNMLDDDDSYDITTIENDDCDTITITAQKNVIGRIIGREGRIVRSLRNIVNAYGAKYGKKIKLVVDEAN